MYEIGLIIYATAIIASCYLSWDAFKHRFLPIARPMIAMSILLALVCIIRFLDLTEIPLPRWASQFLDDFEFFGLKPLIIPLWIWMLLEYYKDQKIRLSNKILLLFLIQPAIVTTLALFDIFTNGFISQVSPTALINPGDRLGAYLQVRHIYGVVAISLIILVTPYLVRKHQQSPLFDLALVTLTMAVPFTFHILYRDGHMDLSLGAPALIFSILWGSRQYRLLNLMPVARQGIMDKIDSGILVGNIHSKLLYVNNYAQRLFNLDVSESALQERELSIPAVFEEHLDFKLAEKQTALLQTTRRNNDNEIRYIAATLQPILSPKLGHHLGSSVSFHDITERRQAELALESYSRQKSEFFAGISHEFRTPLTLSLGNIDDTLNDLNTVKPEQLREPLLQAKANNKRLLGLVNQLLELSRLDKGALAIKPVQLELSTYLPMLIANFESLAERQNIQMHFTVSAKARQDSKLYFDSDALDKIIINLVSNALKSITDSQGGHVYIDLDRSEASEELLLTIRDTGCGIPEDAIPKIFEMFYSHQMDNARWPQGTGVGLSLVKQLLVLHEADISVSSVENEGTSFKLELKQGCEHFADDIIIGQSYGAQPESSIASTTNSFDLEQETLNQALPPEDASLPSKPDDNLTQGLSKQVLLAEDNADMRRYIRKHLTDYRLIEAVDGEEALDLAKQTMPDLVLSDVMMPKMNGYDLCKNLKSDAQTSHIPVVLLTAKSDQSEKLEGLSLGADDYLSKPFDTNELRIRIKNLLASRDTIRAFYQANGLKKVISHPELPKRETIFLEKLQNYVRENIDNVDIKISDMAAAVFMSERSLSRKVKTLTGATPKQMLMTIRLEHAAQLLLSSESNITQLSYETGFSDPSHFTRSFKKHYEMTPTEYRERHTSSPV